MIKKRVHPKFNVPNFGAKKRKRVRENWRKQRGIDNKKRIKKSFMGAEPNIGYGNPKELKGVRRSGRRLFVVHSTDQVKGIGGEDAVKYDVAIGHEVSKRKRQDIIAVADKMGVKIVNRGRA
jgi:large subunit ribosomal protein L32e